MTPTRTDPPSSGSLLVDGSYPLLLLGGCALLAVLLRHEVAPASVLVALYVLGSAGVVAILEQLRPAQTTPVPKEDLRADLLHVFFSTTIPSQLAGAGILALGLGATAGSMGWLSEALGVSLWPHRWPLVVQLGLALLIGELGTYAIHRSCHRFPLLWRIHALHHAPERLYVVAAGRNHPIQAILNYGFQTLPVVLLGAEPAVVALYAAFTGVNGIFQHANLRVRAGYLGWLIATPSLHRTHHAKHEVEGNRNFGNNLIVWDLLFGTRLVAPEPEAFGLLGEKPFPVDYLDSVLVTFRDDYWEEPRPEPAPEPEPA